MRLRPYAGAIDNQDIARIRESVRAVDGDVWVPGPDTDDGPPDACWIAEIDGRAVGFTWLSRWSEDDGTQVFLVAGCVDPAHRGHGCGTALLRRQEAYAVSLGSGTGREVLAANADDTQPSAQELLLDNGFRRTFTVVSLSRPVADLGEPTGLPDGIRTRPVLPRHQPQIYDAIRECFVGSGHGFEPLDYPGYLATVRDTDLWVVAWDADVVAGLVTNERQRDGSVDSPWVAVRPPYRRRGLAGVLLGRSLAAMREQGIGVATIRTVAENVNNSVGLYERAGYRVDRRMPRFRKPLSTAGRSARPTP